jgi:hypothetical protein
VLERGLAGTSVTFRGEPRKIEEARRIVDELLVLAVDDDGARERIQELGPPRFIAATTGRAHGHGRVE